MRRQQMTRGSPIDDPWVTHGLPIRLLMGHPWGAQGLIVLPRMDYPWVSHGFVSHETPSELQKRHK